MNKPSIMSAPTVSIWGITLLTAFYVSTMYTVSVGVEGWQAGAMVTLLLIGEELAVRSKHQYRSLNNPPNE